jgi:hypothetical protein
MGSPAEIYFEGPIISGEFVQVGLIPHRNLFRGQEAQRNFFLYKVFRQASGTLFRVVSDSAD